MSGFSVGDKRDGLRAMIAAKRTWLGAFSSGRNKRPDHEIAQRRYELAILEAILDDYQAGRPGGDA